MICPGLGKTRANTQRSGYLLYWFGGKHASYSHSLSGLPRYPRTKRPERQHKRIARRGPCPVQAHYEPATSSPPCLTAHQASRPARAHLGRRSWVGRHRQAAGRMGAHARSPRITVPEIVYAVAAEYVYRYPVTRHEISITKVGECSKMQSQDNAATRYPGTPFFTIVSPCCRRLRG